VGGELSSICRRGEQGERNTNHGDVNEALELTRCFALIGGRKLCAHDAEKKELKRKKNCWIEKLLTLSLSSFAEVRVREERHRGDEKREECRPVRRTSSLTKI